MDATLQIREARAADIAALLELEACAFTSDRLSRRSFRRFLAEGHRIFLVVERGAQLIGAGLVLLRKGSARARLYSLAVFPEFRGQGVARALLKELEGRAVSANCSAMLLEVAKANHQAVVLYEKQGFRHLGERTAYYQDGSDARLMIKDLGR